MTRPNVVNIVGGLGNQLFQYMFGLDLEARTGRPTRFDLSDFAWYGLHGGLKIEEYFEVELPRAESREIPVFARQRLLKKVFASLPFSPIRGDDRPTPPSGGSGYFRGYWQSIDYSGPTLERMRRMLAFRPDVRHAADAAWDRLAPPADAACIQIRRGDYTALPPDAPQYLLPLDYYRQAMDLMHCEAGVSVFYIFSDDIAGVRRELSSPYSLVFVEPSISPSAGTDLCLMTRFRHHIMSNSTFGWWAAILRQDEAGEVIAPCPWLNPRWKGSQALRPRLLPGWREIEVALS